ncbi:hypothetical protein AMS68_001479 [Peltaster fructicola]|uniref:Major facilitator superfamily (MFS) profile domain-containing protein n=1 Tax=Peltaster fructicola TaxID=286661 RepID=A0A6H0XMH9_9PEZI|nr:hypothetical protein AMS68_001479 [Peltaster fructicola]
MAMTEARPASSGDVEKQAESITASENTTSTIAPPTVNALPGVPDGGTQAWLQVVAAWVLMFNTFGLINTFGVYQTYYESGALFVSTSSNIAWIGSIQAYAIMFVGFLSGPVFDAGHLRPLLIGGSFLIVFGHMMLSLCHAYWQVLLAQGFAIGLGSGLLFVPSVAIMPGYFSKKLGLAIGLAVSGSSLGGIIYPIAFYRLIREVGFGWSVRILGFIAMAMLLMPIFCMHQRVKPAAKRALIDLSAFTDWRWLSFVFSGTIGFIAVYTVIIYLSFYADNAAITSTEMAFYLVPLLNAGSVVGRTLPNYLSDIFGPLNIIGPCTIIVGILTLVLIIARSAGAIIAVTILYGVFSGVFFAMPPVVFVWITKDKSRIGTRIGMGFTFFGLGALAGGPGGGGVLATGGGDALNWTGLWIYGGVCALVSGALFISYRFLITGARLKVKA